MTALDASSVSALLKEFGQRSALRGGNPFRAKAYARAADNLPALNVPLGQLIAQDRLHEIPGVGDAIADIIKKVHATGTHPALEKMRKEIPEGVHANRALLHRAPNQGPRRGAPDLGYADYVGYAQIGRDGDGGLDLGHDHIERPPTYPQDGVTAVTPTFRSDR